MGQFYYAAKAFDVLERLDPNPEYWEGKRGACVGIFQQIIAGHEPRLDSSRVCLSKKSVVCFQFMVVLWLNNDLFFSFPVVFSGRR